MSVGKKIKEARLKCAYTQEQSAEKLMVSRQTISNWETGKSLPDIESVIRMSDLYQISLDDLLKGDQSMIEKIEKDSNNLKKFQKMIRICTIIIILAGIFEFVNMEISNPVIDFVGAALPWILMGLGVAFACKYFPEK